MNVQLTKKQATTLAQKLSDECNNTICKGWEPQVWFNTSWCYNVKYKKTTISQWGNSYSCFMGHEHAGTHPNVLGDVPSGSSPYECFDAAIKQHIAYRDKIQAVIDSHDLF